MKDTVDTLLPILTLVLGWWLAGVGKRSEVRQAMRIDAADLLAELPAKMWSKGGDTDWINLNTAVDRLCIRLSMAGLPDTMTGMVRVRALNFWRAVEQHPEDDEYLVVGQEAIDRWEGLAAHVGDWLGSNRIQRFLIERDFWKEDQLPRPAEVK